MRALQRQLISPQHGKPLQLQLRRLALLAEQLLRLPQQFQTFRLIQPQMLPQLRHVRVVKAVRRKLLLLRQPNLAIRGLLPRIRLHRPHNVVDRIAVLQELRNPLHTVRNLARDRVQVHPAALLKVGKLRNLQAIQHHLPAHAPRAAHRPLPVVLFELQVVFAQVDADRLQRLQIQLLDILRRRLQDQLQLRMPEQPVRVLAIAPVGRPPARLRIRNSHRLRPQHPQKRVRRHRPRAHLHVIRLL